MITLHILLRVLRISPETIIEMININDIFNDTFQISRIIESVLSTKGFGIVECLLAISLLWMARRFFASLMSGVRCIFHERLKQQPVFYNLAIIVLEVLMVVFFVVIMIAIIAARSIYHFLPFQTKFPQIINGLHTILLAILPLALMFIIVVLCYHFTPGTKPKWRYCIFSSLLCTLSFSVFLKVFSFFLNMTRYNLVYGVLSNIIVLLLDVFTFFVLFLLFLQLVYVAEHFETLLLAELYLLTPTKTKNSFITLHQILFQKPDYFIFKNPSLVEYPPDTTIFRVNDEQPDVFYIIQGDVKLLRKKGDLQVSQGEFFGEAACLMNEPRNQTAIALTKTVLIRIPGDVFLNMLDTSPAASRKALSFLSDYFRKRETSSSDNSL